MIVLQKSEFSAPCPACGDGTPQHYLYAKNGGDILRCARCGLGRTETARFDPSAYYTGD